MAVRYGTQARYASTVRYALFFGKQYGTLVRYVFIAKVRVLYVVKCYKSSEVGIPQFEAQSASCNSAI